MREASFMLARATGICAVCLRRNTLLFRYSPGMWACWRGACRGRVREFLRAV